MPVQIGATTPHYSDPTALMSDCHRRIEMFLRTLVAISKLDGGQLSEEQSRAFAAALKYFREAAPNHTADEEESLFPRLRDLPDAQVQAALAQVAHLEADHREAEILHGQVDVIGQQWLESGRITEDELVTFREAVERLAVIYGEHIEVEDRQIFPVAAQVLSREVKDVIGREMAARRSEPASPRS